LTCRGLCSPHTQPHELQYASDATEQENGRFLSSANNLPSGLRHTQLRVVVFLRLESLDRKPFPRQKEPRDILSLYKATLAILVFPYDHPITKFSMSENLKRLM
jgi:hypothetical protein